jgi:hypothetical protein
MGRVCAQGKLPVVAGSFWEESVKIAGRGGPYALPRNSAREFRPGERLEPKTYEEMKP